MCVGSLLGQARIYITLGRQHLLSPWLVSMWHELVLGISVCCVEGVCENGIGIVTALLGQARIYITLGRQHLLSPWLVSVTLGESKLCCLGHLVLLWLVSVECLPWAILSKSFCFWRHLQLHVEAGLESKLLSSNEVKPKGV